MHMYMYNTFAFVVERRVPGAYVKVKKKRYLTGLSIFSLRLESICSFYWIRPFLRMNTYEIMIPLD